MDIRYWYEDFILGLSKCERKGFRKVYKAKISYSNVKIHLKDEIFYEGSGGVQALISKMRRGSIQAFFLDLHAGYNINEQTKMNRFG
jgi:hypothetical protein